MREFGITIFLIVAFGLCFIICPIGAMLILVLCLIGLFKKPEKKHSTGITYRDYIELTKDKKKN